MLGNEAMEFLKTLHKLDEIWKQLDDAEYNERQLTQFAERYHEHKLKLLGIADVIKSVCELDEWDGGDETNLCDCGKGDGTCKRKQTVL